jgi:hypothetical protein
MFPCPPGLASPLAFLAPYWILALDHDSEHRGFLCGLLIQSRITLNLAYTLILFFSFLFRAVLILHADKGLVHHGSLNLRLFHQVYWVVICSFLVSAHGVFSLPKWINSNFRETVPGKICFLRDFSTNENIKTYLISLAFSFIAVFVIKYMTWRVNRCMSGLCPDKKMSCIGNYKRNAISLNVTTKLLHLWYFNTISYSVSCIVVKHFSSMYSDTTLFMIWSIHGVLFHMLVFFLPFSFELPDDSITDKRITVFYVRKPPPVLEPRRPLYRGNIGEQYSFSEADSEASGHEKLKSYQGVMYGEDEILMPLPSFPTIIGPARIIKVKEWTDDSQCTGKGKGNGRGKCKGKCPANGTI